MYSLASPLGEQLYLDSSPDSYSLSFAVVDAVDVVVDVVGVVVGVDVVVVAAAVAVAVAEDAVAAAGIAVVAGAVGWGGEMPASDAEVEQGNSGSGQFVAFVALVASVAWNWSGLEHFAHSYCSAVAVEFREFDLACPCIC